jgi:hypothetical protein
MKLIIYNTIIIIRVYRTQMLKKDKNPFCNIWNNKNNDLIIYYNVCHKTHGV